MIALRTAAGDEDVGVRIARLRGEQLELARLVAAEREAGEVVPLHEDAGTTERRREARGVFERCRQHREADASRAHRADAIPAASG